MNKAEFIAAREDLVSDAIKWCVALQKYLAAIKGMQLEKSGLTYSELKDVARSLKALNAPIQLSAAELIGQSNNLKQFAEAMLGQPQSEIKEFFFGFFSRTRTRKEIGVFNGQLVDFMTSLKEQVFDKIQSAIETIENTAIGSLLIEAKGSLENLIQHDLQFIPAEHERVERSTRNKPLEIAVALLNARWNTATAILVVILTGVVSLRVGNMGDKKIVEAAKRDLYSEYKIRLAMIEENLQEEPETEATNVISDKSRKTLLRIIDGGYARGKDERAQMSMERIISDLQIRYEVTNNAEETATKVLQFEKILDGTRACKTASANSYLGDLKIFAATNHF